MRSSAIALVLLLCAACGGTRTVGEGSFQKRKLQRGWHIDLHRASGTAARDVEPRIDRLPRRAIMPDNTVASTGDRPPLDPGATDPVPMDVMHVQRKVPMRLLRTEDLIAAIPTGDLQQEEPENLMPRKKLNVWAIPALALALGTVALGFLGTNTLAVVVGIVLTLAVSGISLARMRTREQGGKGFALAGLMIGVVAAIFTAIAIAAYGFE